MFVPLEFSRIFPTPEEVFHTGGVNSSGQSVRVFSVNMARTVQTFIFYFLFSDFDFPNIVNTGPYERIELTTFALADHSGDEGFL